MTHSKSWARRRAVQVLRAARLPKSSWMPGRILVADDRELAHALTSVEWMLYGGYMWHGDAYWSRRFERVSHDILTIISMAGLRNA